jgi:hypothetical protein
MNIPQFRLGVQQTPLLPVPDLGSTNAQSAIEGLTHVGLVLADKYNADQRGKKSEQLLRDYYGRTGDFRADDDYIVPPSFDMISDGLNPSLTPPESVMLHPMGRQVTGMGEDEATGLYLQKLAQIDPERAMAEQKRLETLAKLNQDAELAALKADAAQEGKPEEARRQLRIDRDTYGRIMTDPAQPVEYRAFARAANAELTKQAARKDLTGTQEANEIVADLYNYVYLQGGTHQSWLDKQKTPTETATPATPVPSTEGTDQPIPAVSEGVQDLSNIRSEQIKAGTQAVVQRVSELKVKNKDTQDRLNDIITEIGNNPQLDRDVKDNLIAEAKRRYDNLPSPPLTPNQNAERVAKENVATLYPQSTAQGIGVLNNEINKLIAQYDRGQYQQIAIYDLGQLHGGLRGVTGDEALTNASERTYQIFGKIGQGIARVSTSKSLADKDKAAQIIQSLIDDRNQMVRTLENPYNYLRSISEEAVDGIDYTAFNRAARRSPEYIAAQREANKPLRDWKGVTGAQNPSRTPPPSSSSATSSGSGGLTDARKEEIRRRRLGAQ